MCADRETPDAKEVNASAMRGGALMTELSKQQRERSGASVAYLLTTAAKANEFLCP